MSNILRSAVVLLALFTAVTGLAYPLLMTALGQVLFPARANGSAIVHEGQVIGSRLVGQSFTRPEYFWGRPSAAGGGYDGRASGGSNLGPTSQALADRVRAEAQRYESSVRDIPVDLLTTSGSGLDPHISPAAAYFQAARVAEARGIGLDVTYRLIEANTERPLAGVLGEPRVNVLLLNHALDQVG